ncbi:MAG: hypothetical protein IPK16_17950 [Anaerolineales bacterium]|nr:hypothetical protein [Anaerolineales bacterium]
MYTVNVRSSPPPPVVSLKYVFDDADLRIAVFKTAIARIGLADQITITQDAHALRVVGPPFECDAFADEDVVRSTSA